MTIEQMLAERKRLLEEAKAIDAKAAAENRPLTDDESAQIELNLEQAEDLKVKIEAARKKEQDDSERRARLQAAEAWETQSQRQQTRMPGASTNSPNAGNPANGVNVRITGGEGSSTFGSFGEYLHLVHEAARTPGVGGILEQRILAGASGLNTAVDSEGGFLIPPTFSSEILSRMYERGEILSRVRRIPLTGNELKIPYVNESSRADGSRWGGVRAYWIEEAGTPTATKPDFGQLDLRTKKVACIGYVTEEQLQDAPATGSILLDAFSDELMFAVENAIFQGTGAGQPLGILNADCVAETSKETNQTAATVWGPNVTKMWSRCWARSRRNAVWLVEQSVEPYLWGLTIEGRYGSASTAAEGVPIYFPAGSAMNTGEYATLLGRPVIPVEYAKAVGTAGDIMLADFSQYILADKGGPEQATSLHVRFLYAEQTFRVMYRVDGRPWWQSALTPYSGGDTLSPFVKLAVRS